MGDLLGNALSGVLTYQRSLATVGHNIANASTPGYSRQTVDLAARLPSPSGNDFIGNGVEINDIKREYDAFLTDQIRDTTTDLGRLEVLNEFASLVDDVLADPEGGLSPSLQSFFTSLQDLSNDPDSSTARTVVLARAEELIARFGVLGQRLGAQHTAVNREVEARVGEINALADSLARVNNSIVTAQGSRGSSVAPDLLDRQDELVRQLAERVAVTSLRRRNGTIDVFVGNGQILVGSNRAFALTTSPDPTDPTRLGVAYVSNAGNTLDITAQVTGGQLGGLLDFRRDVLDPALSGLGRVALGLADAVNQQHRRGMDQFGALGGDFFTTAAPVVTVDTRNTGSASVTASIVDVAQLTTREYRLSFDGVDYTLASLDGTRSVSGAGPNLTLDGFEVSVGAGAAAGDSFLVRPTRDASTRLGLAIGDIGRIAAAGPVLGSADLTNTGTGRIEPGEAIDPGDASLLNPVEIVFTAPTVYNITDTVTGVQTVGVSLGNGLVNLNGWQTRIGGTPAAGDRFFVNPNTNGLTDNRNANRLAALVDVGVLDNGSSSLQEAYSGTVGVVGTQTRQADVNREVQASLLSAANDRRESVSGVNLDEEAARMVQLQQAFQASARMLQTASEVFDNLLQVL